ncbi:MAG: PEP-CTERM sorting domain-containing protein [Candidatus Dormibacteraceae bacterium]
MNATFDSVRTDRMERLWGTYSGTIVDGITSTAFQVAQWEIAFDNDLNLNTGTFTCTSPVGDPYDPTILALSQSWLDSIGNGTANRSVPLVLLSGDQIQDQIALKPVPEPATISALGLGLLAMVRLRRKQK